MSLTIHRGKLEGFAVTRPSNGVVGVHIQDAGKWVLIGYAKARRNRTEIYTNAFESLGMVKPSECFYQRLKEYSLNGNLRSPLNFPR